METGVQFAVKMGCHTVAVARGTDKESLARQLGAEHYVDSTKQDVSAELTKLGGARVILATLTDAKSMSDAIGGLGIDGKLMVVGASMQPICYIAVRQPVHAQPAANQSEGSAAQRVSSLPDMDS
jgi:D-arabinose 1-dehydrogenase-like Zn-dependent alcohol dehydrogenase